MLPFLLYSEQVCHSGRTSILVLACYVHLVIGPWLFLVFVFGSFVLHAVSFSFLQRIEPTELLTHVKGTLQVTSSE